MRIAVLDHGMGNLRSVAKALEAAGADVAVTADPNEIDRSDALCVPGQGIFSRCMGSLRSLSLADVVTRWVKDDRPYLGICLGMQVLFDSSEEASPSGEQGLGCFPGAVERLPSDVRVPHIGWNSVQPTGNGAAEYFYFDHSYAVHPEDESLVAGWCEHGRRFAAWIASGSLVCVQFHPEKSGAAGIEFLKGWVNRI